MKILFVTNYYSPAKYGWGYRQLCEEVANGLAARGHQLAILTSTHRDGEEIVRPYPVHRWIQIEPDWEGTIPAAWTFFVGRRRREQQATACFKQLLADFKPDVIFIWHATGLFKSMLKEAERSMGSRVAYYLADYQPQVSDEYISYWRGQGNHPLVKWVKWPLAQLALSMLSKEGKPITLDYENVICVSDYVRRRLVSNKLISANAVVIHNGVDLTEFSQNGYFQQQSSKKLRCLVAGRIVPEKGIHTVIDGFGLLNADTVSELSLTVLGDGPARYRQSLLQKVDKYKLHEVVKFLAPVPREQMPAVLSKHDILILSSEYAEPLARAMQEGMAMGLLVIGTITGGSGELLAHEKTGLVFEAGNPQSLADQLARAKAEPDLVKELAKAGQQEVVEKFNINRTIERIEQYLLDLVKN